jgi:hypothetical protein
MAELDKSRAYSTTDHPHIKFMQDGRQFDSRGRDITPGAPNFDNPDVDALQAALEKVQAEKAALIQEAADKAKAEAATTDEHPNI